MLSNLMELLLLCIILISSTCSSSLTNKRDYIECAIHNSFKKVLASLDLIKQQQHKSTNDFSFVEDLTKILHLRLNSAVRYDVFLKNYNPTRCRHHWTLQPNNYNEFLKSHQHLQLLKSIVDCVSPLTPQSYPRLAVIIVDIGLHFEKYLCHGFPSREMDHELHRHHGNHHGFSLKFYTDTTHTTNRLAQLTHNNQTDPTLRLIDNFQRLQVL